MNILAVDPGDASGLAWMDADILDAASLGESFAESCSWVSIDGSVAEQTMKIWKGIERLDVRVVMSEASDMFLLRGGKSLSKHALKPIKLAGALDAMCAIRGLQFLEQTPAQAKGVVTDDILKAYGFNWHKRDDRHAMDAMRHLILLWRRVKTGSLELDI